MTHTKGPWLITPDYEGGEPAQCISAGGFDIATAWGGYLASDADARLIAAAPDLLEALEAACDDLEQATLTQIAAKHHGLAQASQESLDTARAAIAKAKGTPEAGI